MRIYYLLGFFLLSMIACRQDNRTPLFDLFYPNLRFTIQAGENPLLPGAYVRQGISTNISNLLQEFGTDTMSIGEISALEARIVSLNGLEYDFLSAISVRICEDGPEPCIQADEVFYLDRLQEFREDEVLQLLPGLRNARRVLIKEDFRLEIVVFFAFSPPANYESQLNMTFRAYE